MHVHARHRKEKDMTNEQIIFLHRIDLMGKGIIGTTGRKIEIVGANGERKIIMEPEEIHTFAGWKQLGYVVKCGEHAISKFKIWKYTLKKAKEEDEAETERMIMTEAFFFSERQVEVMQDRQEGKTA